MRLSFTVILSCLVLFGGCTINVKEETKDLILSASSAGLTQISLENDLFADNDITVTGVEAPQVIVSTQARMLVLEDSDENLEEIQLQIGTDGAIGFSYPHESWDRIRIGDIAVQLDKTLNSVLQTLSGDISVTDMQGSVHAETMSGDCAIETSRGCEIISTSGNCEVNVWYDTTFNDTVDIDVEAASGDIDIFLPDDTLAFKTGGCYLNLKSTSGDISITVPKGFTANLTFSSKSGDDEISSLFVDSDSSTNRIRCKTTSGDLTIETYAP